MYFCTSETLQYTYKLFYFDTLSVRRLYGSQLLFLPSDKKQEEEKIFVEEVEEFTNNVLVHQQEILAPTIIAPKNSIETPISPQIPIVEAIQHSPSLPFSSGQKIDWKSRKNAKIVVILHEEEFRNRFLTNALRFFISDIGISFENVNFGIYKENTDLYDLSDMPHLIGVLFTSKSPIESNLYKTKEKIIYISPKLITLAGDVQLQELLKNSLLEIKNLLFE